MSKRNSKNIKKNIQLDVPDPVLLSFEIKLIKPNGALTQTQAGPAGQVMVSNITHQAMTGMGSKTYRNENPVRKAVGHILIQSPGRP